jgi:hypothetical protein
MGGQMNSKASTKSLKGEAVSDATPPARLAALADNGDVTVRRAVARNPGTPPVALDRLSHSSDKATREAVAGNPNASAAVLTRLGGQFPKQLLGNPALDFMLLENPGLFSEVPEETLTAIAKREDCSPEMLAFLARGGHGKGLLMSLVQNGATPATAIRFILDASPEALAEQFSVPENEVLPVQVLAKLHVSVYQELAIDAAHAIFWCAMSVRFGIMRDPDEGLLLQYSAAPQTLKDDVFAWSVLEYGAESAVRRLPLAGSMLEAIACTADKRVLNQIRKAAQCPPWLADATDASQARAAILNSQADSHAALSKWLDSGSAAMRLVLANHPLAHDLPKASETLCELANSRLERDREYAACCPDTDAETLLRLAGDEDLQVVGAVAANQRCTPEILDQIYDSRQASRFWKWRVRPALARNPSASAHLIETLAEAGEDAVADNPVASESALRALFAKGKTLAKLAKHPRLPVDLLDQLSASKDEAVFESLLQNSLTPDTALLRIASFKDEDYFVFSDWDRKLVMHPNTSGQVLDLLIKREVVDLDNHGVRLAKDPRISAASIEKLAAAKCDEPIRKHLALNPATPILVLDRLVFDKDENVRKTAQRALKKRSAATSQ